MQGAVYFQPHTTVGGWYLAAVALRPQHPRGWGGVSPASCGKKANRTESLSKVKTFLCRSFKLLLLLKNLNIIFDSTCSNVSNPNLRFYDINRVHEQT